MVNDTTLGYLRKDNPDFNAGLDVKYNINSNLTLDLTANTDFAQVEADNQQVNLTRYSLFFPEKRMFFQERSSLFSFNLGGSSDLFYSRNIGMADGVPIRIYGGARMTGKMGKWEMGLIDMQTAEHENTPSENFGIFRLRKQVINPNSYVGGIFTSRIGINGNRNYAYGFDGIFKVFGLDYLEVKAAQTYDMESDTVNSDFIDPSFFSINWERRSQKGIAYEVNYSYTGQKFNPGIGFVQRGSLQGVSGRLMYGWLPGEKSKLYSYSVTGQFSRYTRLFDGGLESLTGELGVMLNLKTGYMMRLNVEYAEEGVLFDFRLSDKIWISSGDYGFTTLQASISSPMTKPFSLSLMLNSGQYYDGLRHTASLMPTYNVSSSLQLSATYMYSALRFPERTENKKLDIHSVNVRAMYMLNTKLSASVLVQYLNTSDNLIANFRIRYNPKEGNDLYLVYNESRGVSNAESIPLLPDYYNRTIMLKYTHTFKL
jgi:hypothetical protein